MPHPIVLCTDFGGSSAYVGQMKLVLASAAPDARVIDLAHDIPPQNTTAAALILSNSHAMVPRDGVLCVVVDPGVGSTRRIVALETEGGLKVIVPDNGLASAVGPLACAHEVTNAALFRHPIAPVFHGRDVFAPVAAAVANGYALGELGPAISPDSLRALPRSLSATPSRAEVIYVDSFGNLITNLHRQQLPDDTKGVEIGGLQFQRVEHYAQAPQGASICLIGSYDRLEIAVRNGSASAVLGLDEGARFTLVQPTPRSDAHST